MICDARRLAAATRAKSTPTIEALRMMNMTASK
jgi:hypothetical protein